MGFGLSAVVPIGDFKANRLSVERLEPVEDDVNGFQLEREGKTCGQGRRSTRN